MPRQRKTLSGATAQPIGAVAGQMYGAGQEQMDLQRAMPAPQSAAMPAAMGGSSAPATPVPPGGEPAPAGLDKAQLMELAKGLQGKMGMLTNPSSRPGEPVTAGLRSGPGAGPELLTTPRGNPTGETLRRLSVAVGDPLLRELADQVGM